MFYVIYNTVSGSLLDITSTLPDAQVECLTIAAFDREVPDLYYYGWDVVTKTFQPKVDITRQLTVHEFLNRFTAIERISIKESAKTNIALADYMDMLNSASFVDPKDPELYGGLCYLVYLGLIDQTRIQEILG